jgi:ribosomal protein L23
VGGSYVEANQLIHKLVAAVQRNNNTHKNLIAEAVAALFQVNSQKVYRRDWPSSDLH